MDVMDPALVAEPDEDEEHVKRSYTKEMWFLLLVALGLALVLKSFLIQAFFIPSGSMEKTLHGCSGCSGDRVLVNKVVYKFRDIHRGEIVVFNGKGTNFTSETVVEPPKNVVQKVIREVQSWIGFGAPGDKDFIKRVIAVEGDVVACCTNGNVTVNGQELVEPYVYRSDTSTPQMAFNPTRIPENELWLMGDHRDGSSDSRFNGTVPEKAVVGRAFAVFWPPGRAKVLGVPGTFDPPGGAQAAPHVLGFALAVPITVVRRRLKLRG